MRLPDTMTMRNKIWTKNEQVLWYLTKIIKNYANT